MRMRRLFCLIPLIALLAATRAQTLPANQLRGDKVEWARLQCNWPYWDRHANADAQLLRFFRRSTSLSIGEAGHAARASDLEDLCSYPFLFAESIAPLTAAETRNLGEYLRRGGFIFIDGCVNTSVNPNLRRFLQEQVAVLQSILPDLTVIEMPPEHEVFSIYFKMRKFPPSGLSGSENPLRALVWGGRTVGIVSISGIQCGRAGYGEPGIAPECLEMTANIYLYAITH
jgi:hypothetical protein